MVATKLYPLFSGPDMERHQCSKPLTAENLKSKRQPEDLQACEKLTQYTPHHPSRYQKAPQGGSISKLYQSAGAITTEEQCQALFWNGCVEFVNSLQGFTLVNSAWITTGWWHIKWTRSTRGVRSTPPTVQRPFILASNWWQTCLN